MGAIDNEEGALEGPALFTGLGGEDLGIRRVLGDDLREVLWGTVNSKVLHLAFAVDHDTTIALFEVPLTK